MWRGIFFLDSVKFWNLEWTKHGLSQVSCSYFVFLFPVTVERSRSLLLTSLIRVIISLILDNVLDQSHRDVILLVTQLPGNFSRKIRKSENWLWCLKFRRRLTAGPDQRDVMPVLTVFWLYCRGRRQREGHGAGGLPGGIAASRNGYTYTVSRRLSDDSRPQYTGRF